jgi:hypothetical protein
MSNIQQETIEKLQQLDEIVKLLVEFKGRIHTRYQGDEKDVNIAYGMEIVYDALTQVLTR